MATMLERLGLRRRTTESPPPIGVVGAVPAKPVKKSGVQPLKQTPKRSVRAEEYLGTGAARDAAKALKNRARRIDEAVGG